MFQARDILIYLSIICQGDAVKIIDMVNNRVPLDSKDMEAKLANRNFKCITILDKDYPESLRQIYPAPIVLYYEGDISLIYNVKDNISIVGSRKYSEYGGKMTDQIATELSYRYNIVSGMARGIDAIAHQAALNNHKKTIAVFGCGTDICYPPSNIKLFNQIKNEGLVLSEYPPGTKPSQDYFPARNRIIAALGNSLLVTDAEIQSGTAITVNFALNLGKEVFAIPHEVGSKGSGVNALIREGAILVEKAEDIFFDLKTVK